MSTTQTEVLKLALEALEPEPYLAEWYVNEHVIPFAITAIKEALAQRTAAVGEDTRSSAATLCRAWVGLTDEQIEAIAEEFGVYGWICDFARAIEAELKEKNDC